MPKFFMSRDYNRFMKRLLNYLIPTFVVATIVATMAVGQSPAEQASVTVGGKAITIKYGAPSVRGRKIFGDGGLLAGDSTYPAWRAGANPATAFHTDADLEIDTLKVPKGDYTLYVWIK